MLDALPKDGYQTDCLVPVPMHPKRIRKRGFNQAAELAKHLSRHIKVPYDITLCQKRINTEPQAQQNAKMRRTNLKNSFTSKAFHYQHITLVDDLMTTGSTAYELALLLKQQGAIRVDLWCCARATGF
jgi:ComF family protein